MGCKFLYAGFLALGLFVPLSVPITAAAQSTDTVELDGRIDPEEWKSADRITDFKVVQPLTYKAPEQPVEGWVMALPEGLAVAMRVHMSPDIPRTRQAAQRDLSATVDEVNINIDFEGDGRTGYNFTVRSNGGVSDGVWINENTYSRDWDGKWFHAVTEDDQGWSAELLIPWYIAPMAHAHDGMRHVKMSMDRIIGVTGERASWPAVTYNNARFVSEFAEVGVAEYTQSLFALSPYVSNLYDNVENRNSVDAGMDIFWKPSTSFQLSGTINPDFGQVESDDLVINFGAIETFFSERRPFFTENQSIFEYSTASDSSQLLYTRRVGGAINEAGGVPGDITAAAKLNGSFGNTTYALFYADEADEIGRSFSAIRLLQSFDKQNLGLMVTNVDKPFIDRTATVLGVDHDWRPSDRWSIRSRLFGSNIKEGGQSSSDPGLTIQADYEPNTFWRQQWVAMYFGDELQINDAGYLARNDYNYLHWELRRRFTDMPEESRYGSKDWRMRLTGSSNNSGERLPPQLRVSRQSQLRNGGAELIQFNVNGTGMDDLLTRGGNSLRLPTNYNFLYEYSWARQGNWSFASEYEIATRGLANQVGFYTRLVPTYFVTDNLSIYTGWIYEITPDSLIWAEDNIVGRYKLQQMELDAGIRWNPTPKQEVRVKLQAYAVNGPLKEAIDVQPNGSYEVTDELDESFNESNFGFQIRYRYELAPLSYLYVVYGRGGYQEVEESRNVSRVFGESFSLRDDEQLVVKFTYRFEL